MSSDREIVCRDDRRYKSFLPALMRFDDTTIRCHVLNLSASGALLHLQGTARSGPSAELIFADMHQCGTIAWHNTPRLGFRFAVPLSAANVEQALFWREKASTLPGSVLEPQARFYA